MPISVHELENLVLPCLQEADLVLCEIKFTGSIRKPLIQLFIDKKEGFVTVGDCVRISREVQDLLGLQDNVPPDYRLEVSSPGIDYPLSELWQFEKNRGRLIRLVRGEKGNEKTVIAGRILDVAEGRIALETDDGPRDFALAELAQARIELEKTKKKKSKRKRHETRRR